MKKSLSILLSVLLIASTLFALPFNAGAQVLSGEADLIYYSLDTATGTMTISPSTYGGTMSNYNATNTPWNSYKNDIKKVVFENGIDLIGANAFNGCKNLTDIEFSDNLVVISTSAFVGCSSLKSVEMPDSVCNLNGSAFMNCTSLKTVKLSKSITSVSSFVFKNCTSLESIAIPASASSVENNAFEGCTSLKDVSFEKSQYMVIHDYAFSGCTSLSEGGVFYNGREEDWNKYLIYTEGNESFINAPIRFIEEGKCGDNVNYVHNPKTGEVVISGKGATYDFGIMNASPFTSRDNITSVIIEEGVTSIGNMMFSQTTVKSITLPSTLERIGESAFYECAKLSNPIIPGSVNEIGQSAFYGCSSITAITLSGALTRIESSVFANCYALETIELPGSVSVIISGAFMNCSSLASISLWYNVGEIQRAAFYGCTALKDVYFYGTGAQFRQITIDGSNEPFEDATPHYQKIVGQCGENVYHSFDENTGTLVLFGSGDMFEYDDKENKSPFFNRDDIISVEVRRGVASISPYAFFNCTNLRTISLSDSVESIGKHAFGYCYHVSTVNYDGSDESWNKIAIFEGNGAVVDNKPQLISGKCGTNATFTLSTATGLLTVSGKGKIFRDELKKKNIHSYVKNIVIEEGITGIHVYVFRNMENLETVYIPDSLKEISLTSFYGNNSYYTVSARCNNKEVQRVFAEDNHEVIKRHREDKKYYTENKKDATCTASGYYELNRHCMDCGVIVESQPHTVAALGHDYVITTTKATFEKDGKIVRKCSRCGKSSTSKIYRVTASLTTTKLTYNGKPQYPGVKLMDTNKTGLHMSDYSYKWQPKSTDIGNYVVTITLKGNNYTGTKKLAYKINPKGTSIASLKSNKSKQIRVAWNKQTTKTSGYQIQVSTDSTFKNAVKTYTVSGKNTQAKNISNLKGGKKYYVRIRTYTNKSSTKFYSDWSKAKTVTTKK